MPDEESNEELVNRAIEEVLSREEKPDEGIKKRKPKPFRYLTGEEAQIELSNQKTEISVMNEESLPNIVEDKFCILGLGDIETIENVLKKHEASKQVKEK
jgi:hypothetical protein